MHMDDKELRTEWLKRKFASFEYHEEMLKEYWAAIDILDRHWNDPKMASREAQGEFAGSQKHREWPGITAVMRTTGLHNLKQISRPGHLDRNEWIPGVSAGWARTVRYNLGARGLADILGIASETYGMQDSKAQAYGRHIGRAIQMAGNIELTVENRWSDDILNEKYTGPINWPTNWEEEIKSVIGASSTTSMPTGSDARREANHSCPRAGFWWTPAKQHSRRYFNQGEIMPDFPDSQYGATIWYWDQDQS
jgi:hypothetical protein